MLRQRRLLCLCAVSRCAGLVLCVRVWCGALLLSCAANLTCEWCAGEVSDPRRRLVWCGVGDTILLYIAVDANTTSSGASCDDIYPVFRAGGRGGHSWRGELTHAADTVYARSGASAGVA